MFVKWASLNQFHEVVKNLNYPRIYQALSQRNFKIKYGLKVKLHGTNASVRIHPDGKVVGQKRSGDVYPGNDNAGFAVWVAANEKFFADLARNDCTTYIFGEWCGPGVQNGVACSQTPTKVFYPFAIEYHNGKEFLSREVSPEVIENTLGEYTPDDIIVIPWVGFVELDLQDKTKLDIELLKLNRRVEEIGERDPFIAAIFDIKGEGEGVVAYPLVDNSHSYTSEETEFFSWFNFKAKCETHRVNKTKLAAQMDPEKFANANRFADAYCTDARMEQGFREAISERKDMKLTPEFIKWVVSDIYKESETERAESPELDWKQLSKACSTRAVLWYKRRVMTV
jgi:hypothetical protein